MATTTVNSSAGEVIIRHLGAGSWAAARDGSGGSYDRALDSGLGLHSEREAPGVFHLAYQFFTFSIPSLGTITAVSLFIKPVSPDYNNAEATNPASPSIANSTLDVTADNAANSTNFLKGGTTKQSDTVIPIATFHSGVGTYQEFPFNATGIAAVDAAQGAKFNCCLKGNNSYSDATAPAARSVADVGSVPGGASPTYLSITYTSASNMKTVDGLAIASVKVVDGLAIASVKSINSLS